MVLDRHFSGYNNVIVFFLALFLFLIPMSLKYSDIVLGITFALFFIGYIVFKKKHPFRGKSNIVSLLSSTFIIYLFVVISFLYCENRGEIVKFIEYRLSMLLFPLIFFLGFQLTPREREVVFSGFVAGVLLKILYFWGLSIYGLTNHLISFNNLSYSFIKTLDTIFSDHRTYFSFYALMALVIVVGSQYLRYSLWFKIFTGIVVLTTIFSFESRAMIAISAFLTIIFPFCIAKKSKIIKVAAVTYSVLLLSLIVPITSGSYISMKDRISESSEEFNANIVANKPIPIKEPEKSEQAEPTQSEQTETTEPVVEQQPEVKISTYDSRASRWKIALYAIAERPLTGYGSGNEKDVLIPRYIDNKMDWSANMKLDVHNQYLSFALENGIFAALFYIFLLSVMLVRGIKGRDLITIFFVVICAWMSLFENILNVNWMITFFAFMSSVIIFRGNYTKATI